MSSTVLRSASSLPIRSFSAQLSRGLDRVAARFIQQMIVGIHRARSVHLTDIARSLGEDVELHATHKRLSRNLSRQGLTEFISRALLQRAAQDVTPDKILVVCYYDLPRQSATRMAYDQGNATRTDDGYYVCDISAVDPVSPDHYMPLLSHLWSRHAPDYDGDATEILAAVNQVHSATGGRAAFYFRQAPEYSDIFRCILQEPNLRTILRVHQYDTEFMVDGQLKALYEFISDIELPHGKMTFKMVAEHTARELFEASDIAEVSMFSQFGAIPVQYMGEPTTLIISNSVLEPHLQPTPGTMQRARSSTLAYVATGVEAGTLEQQWQLLQNQYLARHMAGVVFAHKSRFNLSDFRVLTYDRLQLLNILLQAVTHFEAYIEKSFIVEDRAVTDAPHKGDHARDFMAPDKVL